MIIQFCVLVPPNGLFIYCGTVVKYKYGIKEKEIVRIHIEPLKPVEKSLFICDLKFHTEPATALLADDEEKFGFIIMDGYCVLFGTLQVS